MKKIFINIVSVLAYFILVQIQLGIFVGINLAVTGRPTGGISAMGIVSFWTSYKIIKILKLKFLKNNDGTGRVNIK